jgi:uncharacterized membrane protein
MVWDYVHPLLGGATLLLLGYVAVLGFQLYRAARPRRDRVARHARLAPLAYWAVLGSWLLAPPRRYGGAKTSPSLDAALPHRLRHGDPADRQR